MTRIALTMTNKFVTTTVAVVSYVGPTRWDHCTPDTVLPLVGEVLPLHQCGQRPIIHELMLWAHSEAVASVDKGLHELLPRPGP